METKYLERFKRLDDRRELFKLNGGRVLIEVMPKQEVKTAGGIVLSAPTNYAKGATFESQTGTLGVVLLTGEGYVDASGATYDIGLKPGNVVLINELGMRTLSVFPGLSEYSAGSIAIVDETVVQMSWPDLEAFDAYAKLLS